MKYSRYQHLLHVEKAATLLRDDPGLSARAVQRFLDDQGYHFSRSYTNSLVADANLKLADEERRMRTGMYRIGDWLLKLMNLNADIQIKCKEMETILNSYPDDVGPRH